MSNVSAHKLIMAEDGIDSQLRNIAEALISESFSDMSLENLDDVLSQMDLNPKDFNGVIDWYFVLRDYLNFRRSIEEHDE